MSVDLSPSSQLAFARPLTQLVKKVLVISNPNAESVAFKVKTTAPKQYCVRPNSGRIEPGEKVEVSVLLQPMKEDPPQGVKCKDKFLVQSATISSDKETLTLQDIWSAIEKEGRGKVHEQKIRCAYLDADTDGERHEITQDDMDKSTLIDGSPNVNVNGGSPTTPIATQTQFHQADTTLPSNTTRDDISSPSSPSNITHSSFPPTTNGNGTSFATTNAASPADRSLPSGLPPVNTNQGPSVALPPSIAVLTEKSGAGVGGSGEVDKLKQEIKELKEKLANATTNPTTIAGLRKRGGGVSDGGAVGDAEVKMREAVGQGVPVEVVAGLVLGVFVMTYLFF